VRSRLHCTLFSTIAAVCGCLLARACTCIGGNRIHKYASCSNECFILALIYIDRLIQSNNFLLTELNVHRVVITAVLLAAKFFDDAYYNNAYYAKVGGVLVSEMNGLEVDFLFRINFTLHVKPEVFAKYHGELMAQAQEACRVPLVVPPPPLPTTITTFNSAAAVVAAAAAASAATAATNANNTCSSSSGNMEDAMNYHPSTGMHAAAMVNPQQPPAWEDGGGGGAIGAPPAPPLYQHNGAATAAATAAMLSHNMNNNNPLAQHITPSPPHDAKMSQDYHHPVNAAAVAMGAPPPSQQQLLLQQQQPQLPQPYGAGSNTLLTDSQFPPLHRTTSLPEPPSQLGDPRQQHMAARGAGWVVTPTHPLQQQPQLPPGSRQSSFSAPVSAPVALVAPPVQYTNVVLPPLPAAGVGSSPHNAAVMAAMTAAAHHAHHQILPLQSGVVVHHHHGYHNPHAAPAPADPRLQQQQPC
jgi:hypothetical protein